MPSAEEPSSVAVVERLMEQLNLFKPTSGSAPDVYFLLLR